MLPEGRLRYSLRANLLFAGAIIRAALLFVALPLAVARLVWSAAVFFVPAEPEKSTITTDWQASNTGLSAETGKALARAFLREAQQMPELQNLPAQQLRLLGVWMGEKPSALLVVTQDGQQKNIRLQPGDSLEQQGLTLHSIRHDSVLFTGEAGRYRVWLPYFASSQRAGKAPNAHRAKAAREKKPSPLTLVKAGPEGDYALLVTAKDLPPQLVAMGLRSGDHIETIDGLQVTPANREKILAMLVALDTPSPLRVRLERRGVHVHLYTKR